MTATHLGAFALASLVIVAIPGPSVMFIVGQALARGRRAAAITVCGNAVGAYLQVVVVAFGIGILVERSIAVSQRSNSSAPLTSCSWACAPSGAAASCTPWCPTAAR